MKPEPESGDQRVPSQSKTATRGARWWTRAKKGSVVRAEIWAGGAVKIEAPKGVRTGWRHVLLLK
jgi:hypothetical protein